jgi:hypothetical protein
MTRQIPGNGGKLPVYDVFALNGKITIDAEWDKPEWNRIIPVDVRNLMGEKPHFLPRVQAKMMYDKENLYVIFRVRDRFIRSSVREINGRVWDDSCVEFFFSPDPHLPERYFNLEINCNGIALMHYNTVADLVHDEVDPEYIKKIEIAHSLPGPIDHEIKKELTWTLEYRLPIEFLKNYSVIAEPSPGTIWRGNFFKIADATSNPHYLTWSKVYNDIPQFHIPEFFGILNFK